MRLRCACVRAGGAVAWLRPPCARRRRHSRSIVRQLLVGVGGVVARLGCRPALARPGRRRHIVEAGVVVGQRAAKRAAEQDCVARSHTRRLSAAAAVTAPAVSPAIKSFFCFWKLDEGLRVSYLEG
eukprot:2606566-Prymnesium_polylepis.2